MSEDIQRFLLSRGRPPQPRNLAGFLKEHFTVDFEKEKARLDSYRDVTAADVATVMANGAGSPPLALDEDSSFASSGDEFDTVQVPLQQPVSGGSRAAATVNPVKVENTANTAANLPRRPRERASASSSRAKMFAAALVSRSAPPRSRFGASFCNV